MIGEICVLDPKWNIPAPALYPYPVFQVIPDPELNRNLELGQKKSKCINIVQIFMSKFRIWFRIRPLNGYYGSETVNPVPYPALPKGSDPDPKHWEKVKISEKFSGGDQVEDRLYTAEQQPALKGGEIFLQMYKFMRTFTLFSYP